MRPPTKELAILSVAEAVKITGKTADRLRAEIGVQELTREFPNGKRVPSLRFPTDLLDYLKKSE